MIKQRENDFNKMKAKCEKIERQAKRSKGDGKDRSKVGEVSDKLKNAKKPAGDGSTSAAMAGARSGGSTTQNAKAQQEQVQLLSESDMITAISEFDGEQNKILL